MTPIEETEDELTVRNRLEAKYGQVWNTEEVMRDFEITSFMAPFTFAIRRSDKVEGTLTFQHYPRFYYDFR